MNTAIYLGHSPNPPVLNGIEVKDSADLMFLGEPFTFQIIGYSHYIKSEEMGFHEIASCKEPEDDGYERVPLDVGVVEREDFDLGGKLVGETVVEGLHIDEFPSARDFDLRYRFGEDAYTTINIGDTGYETYHTYPEHSLALFSRTEFDLF